MDWMLWNGGTVLVIGAIMPNILPIISKFLMFSRGQDMQLLNRSKCRIAVETILFMAIFLIIHAFNFDPLGAFLRILMVSVLYGIGITDQNYRLIPNEYIIALALIAILMIITGQSNISLPNACIGGMAGCMLFYLPYKKAGICGGGDVKLCTVIGISIGLVGMLITVILMGVFLISYIIFMLVKERRLAARDYIPLGPIIAASCLIQIILIDIIPDYARLI